MPQSAYDRLSPRAAPAALTFDHLSEHHIEASLRAPSRGDGG